MDGGAEGLKNQPSNLQQIYAAAPPTSKFGITDVGLPGSRRKSYDDVSKKNN